MTRCEDAIISRSKLGHRKRFTEGMLNNDLILHELNIAPDQAAQLQSTMGFFRVGHVGAVDRNPRVVASATLNPQALP